VQEELFGPVLPILKYTTTEDAKQLLRELSPDALAVYVFTEDLEEASRIIDLSYAGSAAVNDCLAQIAPTSLPFGGFGQSGFGSYRGRDSIETFSHKQTVVTVPTSPEFEGLLGWRYPYSESEETIQFVKANLEVPLQ
jgi:acyl-CoA reductase-like NAD-dependent aldehyde dehydrogenase